jgi:hypothetical protein
LVHVPERGKRGKRGKEREEREREGKREGEMSERDASNGEMW